MGRIMVDIQSAAAEIRRGKKIEEKRKKKETREQNIMACPITWGGHNYTAQISSIAYTVKSQRL